MHTFAQKPTATQQTTFAKSTIPGRGHLGQSPEVRSILYLQRTIGNQAVQRMLRTDAEEPEADLTGPASLRSEHDFGRIPIHPPAAGAIQTKLAVNELRDSYEQDADRMAEQVMRTPEPQLQRACPCGGGCPKCHTEHAGREHEGLQTKRVQASDAGQRAAPPIVHEVLRSPGHPLDPATRAFMEPRFGYDFSRVRVHTGAAAEESARNVNAHAFAVGHDVVFGAGQFAPGTQGGRRLIAHELAHTVQQSDGAPTAIARAPTEPPFAVNQQDMVYLQNTMSNFYNLLTADERASLQRNTTVVIALVTHENKPTLVYTVASNSTNPGFRAAAAQLGLTRWDPEGINSIAGEHHAEQLTVEAASKLGFKVHGIAVTREPCVDCGPVVAEKGIPIVWVRDPNPAPRTPGAAGGSPAKGIPAPPPPRQSPAPAKTPTQPAGTVKITAQTGAPLTPVVEATPGFNPGAGARLGSAVQALQGKMVGNLQQDEIAKYERRMAELEPQIEAYLSSGYSVELILIVEKPNRPDVMCRARAFCDQGQLNYFHDLYIKSVDSVKPVTIPSPRGTTSDDNMWSGGSHFVPYRRQGGPRFDINDKEIDKEIRNLPTRDPDHHCEYRTHTLYPQESISPIEASRPPAQPVKTRPRLDLATKKALALAPSRVYILSGNINSYKTAYEVQKKLTGNASFVVVKEHMGGLGNSRTIVSYSSDLDKPRAEALVDIVRSEGVSSVHAELSGDGDDAPGVLQIFFGRDAEK